MLCGRQATAPSTSLVTWSEELFASMIDSVDGQASSVNPACGHAEFSFWRVPLLFMQGGSGSLSLVGRSRCLWS